VNLAVVVAAGILAGVRPAAGRFTRAVLVACLVAAVVLMLAALGPPSPSQCHRLTAAQATQLGCIPR
jgi:hypothetical protein